MSSGIDIYPRVITKWTLIILECNIVLVIRKWIPYE